MPLSTEDCSRLADGGASEDTITQVALLVDQFTAPTDEAIEIEDDLKTFLQSSGPGVSRLQELQADVIIGSIVGHIAGLDSVQQVRYANALRQLLTPEFPTNFSADQMSFAVANLAHQGVTVNILNAAEYRGADVLASLEKYPNAFSDRSIADLRDSGVPLVDLRTAGYTPAQIYPDTFGYRNPYDQKGIRMEQQKQE